MLKIIMSQRLAGVTAHSINAVRQNAEALGKLETIRGYLTKGRNHRVKFTCENGTIITNGLCWGYSGEGPRGLAECVQILGARTSNTNWSARLAFDLPFEFHIQFLT